MLLPFVSYSSDKLPELNSMKSFNVGASCYPVGISRFYLLVIMEIKVKNRFETKTLKQLSSFFNPSES